MKKSQFKVGQRVVVASNQWYFHGLKLGQEAVVCGFVHDGMPIVRGFNRQGISYIDQAMDDRDLRPVIKNNQQAVKLLKERI